MIDISYTWIRVYYENDNKKKKIIIEISRLSLIQLNEYKLNIKSKNDFKYKKRF